MGRGTIKYWLKPHLTQPFILLTPSLSWVSQVGVPVCPELRERAPDGAEMRWGGGEKGTVAQVLDDAAASGDRLQDRFLQMSMPPTGTSLWAWWGDSGPQLGDTGRAGWGLWEAGSGYERAVCTTRCPAQCCGTASPVAFVFNLGGRGFLSELEGSGGGLSASFVCFPFQD